MTDALRTALLDVKAWAKKGAARDAGKRHGVTLPEDSDFPEPVESDAQEPPSDVFEPPAENADELENGAVDPEQLEQLLALLGSGG